MSVLSEADVQAAVDTFAGGWLTMGPKIQALEASFAEQMGVAHAVAVSSGAAALHLACLAAGVGPQRSAVVGALAGVEAALAPRHAGGTPLRADVADPARPRLALDAVLAAAREDTVAVVASHLGGTLAGAEALRAACEERAWILIEDATDALGAHHPDGRPAGTVGHLGCFSFAAGRVVGVGEGGMVVSDDEPLAARVRSLRSHAMTSVTWDRHRGHAESYDIVDIGFNLRMDEPRAALAASRLARLDALVAERRARAATLRDELAGLDGVEGVVFGDAPQHVVVLARDAAAREAVRRAVEARGLATGGWPDGFVGLAGVAPAPAADAARARAILVELP
jgi:dTDP-4-amino-4,6-dideoxygalactose transaminase